jgi:cytochrome c-type biogenesis protein CcmE
MVPACSDEWRKMTKNTKSIVMTTAILLAGVILIAAGILRSNLNFYTTISEVRKNVGEAVRVLGTVEAGTWKPAETVGTYTFTLTDKRDTMAVRYTGAPVDVSGGRQIVVEGSLDKNGTFQARRIMTKCESHYSAKRGKAVSP